VFERVEEELGMVWDAADDSACRDRSVATVRARRIKTTPIQRIRRWNVSAEVEAFEDIVSTR
jgi:hypothetical protein